MELDELKYELKNKLSGRQDKSTVDLVQLLHSKTRSVISKLKRSLRFEMIVAIVCTVIFTIVGMLNKNPDFRIYFGVFSLVFMGFVVVIAYLLVRITHLSKSQLSVKTNLQSLVTIIQEYIKRSFQFTMALLPICLVFSFWLGYNEPSRPMPAMNNSLMHTFKTKAHINALLILYFAGLAIVVYHFTKWYLNKLYGNYINELKAYMTELKEDD